MKSLVDLVGVLLLDCGRKSGAPVDRDVKTLRDRVGHEGDSFITITLSAFARDFDRSLAEGRVAPGLFLSFRKEKSGIPSFLKGFLCQVFDSEGFLLPNPSIDCIRSVRQICLFGKKVQRPCSQEREADAIAAYRQCDDNVVAQFPGYLDTIFQFVAHIVVGSLELDQHLTGLVPRHGPGATRESISGNQKWVFSRWHRRLEEAGFDFLRFGRASQSDLAGAIEAWPLEVEPEDEEPVRVVFVPKTMKTPRVIAVEPVCMQYAQQALSRVLVERLSTSPLTRGHVNFCDQTVNQRLALDASGSGKYATLDMSEASDRVGTAHVERLLRVCPAFKRVTFACRSTRAELPNGDIVTLKKFASMGSALCFPIESLVFFTSIIASMCYRDGIFPNARAVRWYAKRVYVFGDDLIVPTDYAPAVVEGLESLGFKVNANKSFWNGRFRESCGVDAFDYQEVTPVYLRRDLPRNRADASGIVSCVATSNQLFDAGYYRTAAAIRKAVEDVVGSLPTVPRDHPAVGWFGHSEAVPPRRWNAALQRHESLCLVASTLRDPDPLDGDPALAKCFRLIGACELPRGIHLLRAFTPVEQNHLLVSARRYGLTLKRRWVPLHN